MLLRGTAYLMFLCLGWALIRGGAWWRNYNIGLCRFVCLSFYQNLFIISVRIGINVRQENVISIDEDVYEISITKTSYNCFQWLLQHSDLQLFELFCKIISKFCHFPSVYFWYSGLDISDIHIFLYSTTRFFKWCLLRSVLDISKNS